MHPLLLLAGLALFLAACGRQVTGWTVTNATPEQEQQALDIVAAARTVTGDPLKEGSIGLVTTPYGLDGTCGVPAPYHVSGCTYGNSIVLLIMPERGLGPSMDTTALAHELCHRALNTRDEAVADEWAAKVIAEYHAAMGV